MTATADVGAVARIRSVDPWSGVTVYDGGPTRSAGVAAAVARAAAAQEGWARTSTAERGEVLFRFAQLVEDCGEGLADLIVAEMGKRRAEAEGEVEWTVLSARWYADHPPAEEQAGEARVRRVPLGVVAVITPWNVPLLTAAWKWMPALMAGNTVVWKPSELTPAVAVRAAELLIRAGLPPGIVELVIGDGETGRVLVSDDRVQGVHFTGSTRTGRGIATAVAPRLIPCALELGGLNPVVVFADADLDRAVECIVAAGTAINGQKCTATRRVLVEARAAGTLTDALAARIGSLVVGDPRDRATELGPLVTEAAAVSARESVSRATAAGARVVAAGEAASTPTSFPATLVSGLAPQDPLRSHELFAPVVSVAAFADDAEAWAAAADGPYGLAASVHTSDPDRLREAPHRLRAGVVNLNRRGDAVDLEAPFGGLGASGNGQPEGGSYVYSSLTSLQACYQP